MIILSNKKIEYFAASGSLGYDGKGYFWERPLRYFGLFDVSLLTPITKTLTYNPNKGNCKFNFNCVKFVKNGVINYMGLPNPGIKEWIKHNKDYKGIVSICPENDISLIKILELIKELNIIGIELNPFCPNKYSDYCQEQNLIDILKIIKIYEFPLIIKLSVVNNLNIIPRIEYYIDAISINSVPFNYIYPNKKGPFGYNGALSGKIIQPYVWNFIKRIINITDTPVIGCSIWDYDDIDKLYDIGCKAVSFGSIFLRYPWRPTLYMRRNNRR